MAESLPKVDSQMEKTIKQLNGAHKESKPLPMSAAYKAKICRVFGRDNKLFPGRKHFICDICSILTVLHEYWDYSIFTCPLAAADIFLWRNKKITAEVLGFATAIWVLFELLEYHFLTLICHVLILALAFVYLWSNASTLLKKSPPRIPEVRFPEDVVLGVAGALRIEINGALAVLHDIAAGKDVKKFIVVSFSVVAPFSCLWSQLDYSHVIAGLWLFSVIGSCCSFLTLCYISFLLLHTVPVLYEKYEVKIDAFSEKAEAQINKQHAMFEAEIKKQYAMFEAGIKKQYAVFDAKVLSKIPKGFLKGKKFI
ncbi:reticulon-like protein B3 [Apium graveolens]|uniref:reticulon-like protein B3 n=1 Tax=Apium graveolens TaxID=4045 RepID=UPI003D7995AD